MSKHDAAYEAISYEWGAPKNQARIELNGQNFHIQHNLFAFLKVLRPTSGEARVLWADAICINQKDGVERDQQVRVMREIYAQADRVLSWLGPATEESDRAFDRCRDRKSLSSVPLDGANVHFWWEGLKCILQCSYWTRMWIVPEVILARDLTICCGLKQASWSEVADAVDLIDPHSRRWLTFEDGQAYLLLRDYRANRYTRTFWDLLRAFHQSECSDPRDRVYALLGSKTTFRKGLPIIFDYNCSLGELFFDTERFLSRMHSYNMQKLPNEPRGMDDLLRKALDLSVSQCLIWARDLSDSDKYRYEDLHKRRYKRKVSFEDSISNPNDGPSSNVGQHVTVCYGVRREAARFWSTSKLEPGDFIYRFEGGGTCVSLVYRPIYGDGPYTGTDPRAIFIGTGIYEDPGAEIDFQPFLDCFGGEKEDCLFKHAREEAPARLRLPLYHAIRLSVFDVMVLRAWTRT